MSQKPGLQPKVFNQLNKVVEGWYWALRSNELHSGKTKHVKHLGKSLVVYRGQSGKVYALDAYCPHMGAHLAEGRVEGESIRCFFHHWKFDRQGKCEDIPCQKSAAPAVERIPSWPVEEKYGLIWIWTGRTARHPVPFPPELEGVDVDSKLGSRFKKNCHPNVMMINAIDEQHFYSVHPMSRNLAGGIQFDVSVTNENNIQFKNKSSVPQTTWFTRLLSKLYRTRGTYDLSYWNGTTGTVTLGPDFLHLYIIFALRPTETGSTEGQTILVTPKRKGIAGLIFNPLILLITQFAGNYFARGDTRVFRTIQFALKTPIVSDHSIVHFMRHLEKQPLCNWGFGKMETVAIQPTTKNPPFSEEIWI